MRRAEDVRVSIAAGAQGAALAAGAAASAMCVPLARAAAVLLAEAVEAFKRSVANREKGRCLLERMQLLAPVLAQIAEHHDSGRLSGAAADGAHTILTRIDGNFRDAARLLKIWATKGKGFFGALRQALESDAFSRDFDRLRDELAARVAELQLYQTVAARVAVDVAAWAAEDAAADSKDRSDLPAAVVGQVDDEAELSEALAEAGMGESRFKELMMKHDISFGELLASLGRMEATLAQHNEKLDRTLSLLQRGQLRDRPADLLDWADLAVDEDSPVGVGAFGSVFQARWRGATVALKLVGKGVAVDPRTINKIYREANLMASITAHPNVVRYFGAVLQKPHYALVLEFCGVPPLWDGGLSIHSLAQLLAEPRAELPWTERLALVAGVAAGMEHLHAVRIGPNRRPVVHADLKAANVLLVPGGAFDSAKFIPKISDFGLSRIRGEATSMSKSVGQQSAAAASGTLAFMAPELLAGGRPSEATDVYSLGMVIYEVLTRRAPFQDASAGSIPKLVEAGTRPRLPLSVGQALEGEGGLARAVQTMVALMQRCWDGDPESRGTFAECSTTLQASLRSLGFKV